MSHRAIVAERQPNDRFNVYYSQNGAENIQLLDELRESLNVHGRIDFESLTGQAVPQIAKQMTAAEESKYTVKSADTGNIVEPRPVAVNVQKEALLTVSDLLQFEVLYVVDRGEVEAYWLTWTYPDVIRPWHKHVEANVYDTAGAPTRAEEVMEYLDEAEPVRTIAEFERGWLSDDLMRDIVRANHRWLYEMYLMAADEINAEGGGSGEGDDISAVSQLIQTPEHWLEFRIDEHSSLVPPSYPFVIPIRIGSPPIASSNRIRQDAEQTRFSIGCGLHAAESVSVDDLHQAYAEALMEIVNVHGERIAEEFVPEEFGNRIAEYHQTQDLEVLTNIWKN